MSEQSLNLKRELFEWIKIIAAAAAIALFGNTCLIANSREPQRGDLVIFAHKAEPGKDKTRLVKRIIGLPGETVDILDNRNHSADARGWGDPYVSKKEIEAKVYFRYFPSIGRICF